MPPHLHAPFLLAAPVPQGTLAPCLAGGHCFIHVPGWLEAMMSFLTVEVPLLSPKPLRGPASVSEPHWAAFGEGLGLQNVSGRSHMRRGSAGGQGAESQVKGKGHGFGASRVCVSDNPAPWHRNPPPLCWLGERGPPSAPWAPTSLSGWAPPAFPAPVEELSFPQPPQKCK